jgi:cbb3-type cytochrome oxidase subunit 3
MKQSVLRHWDIPALPLTALMIFVICFAVYTYWTFKKANKKMYDDASLLPLEDAVKVKGQSYER